MKPPKSFSGLALPPKWRMSFENIIEKVDPDNPVEGCQPEYPAISICNNEGRYWDYYVPTGEYSWTEFDASSCKSLNEVIALVEILVRMR